MNTDFSSVPVPVFAGDIQGQTNTPLCNARDLHAFLQVRRDFTTWIKHRILRYSFVEGEDFQVFTTSGENLLGGRPAADFHLTLDMAKELAMVENNERGRQARRHFIACERMALEDLRHKAELAPPTVPSLVPPGTKLLLTFEANGRYRAEPVPEGAMVVTARQIAEIVEANGYILAKPVDKEFKL
ncbi:antA/AntB antirepressor family protein [Acidithiobacillus sp. MC6.1]|nr:antA/AntB antirepressor family protein [Acidithiobacillus sp. MC6.1]